MKKSSTLKTILYSLVFCFLCVADQRVGSAYGSVQFAFVNFAGIALCLMVLVANGKKEIPSVPALGFSIFCLLAGGVAYFLYGKNQVYRVQWITAVINIWLIGLVAIVVINRIWKQKRKPRIHGKMYLLFVIMMFLFSISKDNSLWTWWYLFMFSLLYVAVEEKEERTRIRNGMIAGILMGFFGIQGLAFVFRPYDTLRYNGMYANPNMNALFYSIVYGVLMGLYCDLYCRKKELKRGLLFRVLILALAGSMWTFTICTMSRSALLGMAVMTAVAGIYCLCVTEKKKIKNGAGMVAGLLVWIVLAAPVTYMAIRYLPPVFHHPIWFDGEYSEEKVHSWDPIDSEKFTDWRQVLEGLLGRMVASNKEPALEGESLQLLLAATEDTADRLVVQAVSEEGKQIDSEDSVGIRKLIYKHYISQLNFTGHLVEENGLQVSEYYFAPHAHDLFLQMAFSFGIPAGVLFLIWVIALFVKLIRKCFFGKRSSEQMVVLLLFVGIVVFGLMEIMWRTGQLSFHLLFVLPMFVLAKE